MPAVPQLNYVQFTETTSTQKLKENYKILHQNKETFFFKSTFQNVSYNKYTKEMVKIFGNINVILVIFTHLGHLPL